MNFERNDGGYQPKGTPNGNCCEPPKGGSAMQDEFDEPKNPYASEDFKNAIKKASEDLNKGFKDFSEDLKRVGEQLKTNADYGKISSINFDDMPTTYSGIMRLNYCNGRGAWQDVMFTLIAHGYEVTARLEDATETERELDGADKFVVIEFEEI